MDQRTLQISGQLVTSSHHGLSGSRVEAWDKEGIYPQVIGIAAINDQGAFHIELDETVLRMIFRDRQLSFAFKILRGETFLSIAPEAITWFIVRRLIWRLLDQTTNTPLPGYVVSSFDLDTGREPRDLGRQVVSDKGLFTLNYTIYPDPSTGTVQNDYAHRFRLQVFEPQGRQLYQTDLRIRTPQTQVLELHVPLSSQNQPAPAALTGAQRPTTLQNVSPTPSPTTSTDPEMTLIATISQAPRPISSIADLASTLHLDLSSSLRTYINKRGISTLSDILTAGGLSHQPDLPVSAQDPTVQTLEAHARLSVLPTDIQTNANLIVAGYTNLYEIASTLPSQFTAKVKATIEAPIAQTISTAAQAQASYLTNEITRLRVEVANGRPVDPKLPLADMLTQICGCQDCENVASPLAYLADLLDYTVRHLMVNGQLMNIDQLSARFCQPFAQLLASCDQLEESVRQVRICIEVLRRYLNDTAEHPEYTLAAYESLLRQNGTSYEELRLAMRARPTQRKALAERLGLDLAPTRPDQLDNLLLSPNPPQTPKDPGQLTEENLENIFGLVSTRRDPLASGHESLLQIERWQHLKRLWQNEDASPGAPFNTRPVIDPDIMDAADLLAPVPGNRAYDLWLARQTLITQTLKQIKALREDPNVGLVKLLPDGQYGLGSAFGRSDGPTVNELVQTYYSFQNGGKISAELTQWQLEADTFNQLASIIAIDQEGFSVQESEWQDVYAILTQRLKHRDMFPAWHMEEQQSPAITLTPDWFWVRPVSLADGTDWTPSAWLSDETVRQQWVKTLQARYEQQQEVVTALQYAVQATEEATLTGLRGILLINAALPNTLSDAKLHELTRHLQIDCEAGTCDMTTRIAQAIETLQGVLFGTRNSLIEDTTLTLDAPNFDEEWQWIGSYATWRAAMLIFLYPENALFPNLLHRQSPGFSDLIAFCQDTGRLDPNLARQAIEQYQRYFADICSLQPVGFRRTAGFLADAPVQHPDFFDFFPFHPDVFAVGQAAATGSFYWSAWHWDTAGQRGGADQTTWDKVQGLDTKSRLVGLFPYHNVDDQVRMALYFHSRKGGVDVYNFVSADGVHHLSASNIQEIAQLVCSSLYQGVISAAGGNTWTLQSSDQILALDVDGDGRDEVVLIAGTPQPDGTLRIGLVREFGGGLVLDWTGSIENGWHLPDVVNPITYLTAPWSGNASKRWGAFVINSSGTQARIGTLGWSPTTGLSVSSTTSVATTNGQVNWQVTLSKTIGGDTYPVAFVGAFLAAEGVVSVLVFEYDESGNADTPVKTLVTVLAPGTNFTLQSTPRQELGLTYAAYEPYDQGDPGSYAIAWKTFCPAQVGEILLFGTRQEYYLDENVPPGHLAHKAPQQGLSSSLCSLLWQNGQFSLGQNSASGTTITKVIAWSSELSTVAVSAGSSGQSGWTLRPDDQFITVASQYVVMQNNTPTIDFTAPPNPCFGVLRYKQDTTTWICETALKKGETLPPTVAGNSTWAVQLDDRVVSWVLANNRVSAGFSPLLISSDGIRVGALAVQNNTLALAWMLEEQIFPPGDLDGMLWSIGPGTSFIVADIDGDGQPEVLARRNIDVLDIRVAVLRPVPSPQLSAYGQPPARYGPIAVTTQNIPISLTNTAASARATELQTIYVANDNDLASVNDIYLDEAFYFSSMEIGRRLAQGGYYTAALDCFRTIYNYDLPVASRRIAYKLVLDGQTSNSFTRAPNWLQDPLNPHAIAQTRQNSYTRYTLLEIINCLLAYADSEFTQANAESVPRARMLYMLVLDLLMADVFQSQGTTCSSIIGELDIQIGEGYWKLVWNGLQSSLGTLKDFALLRATVASVKNTMLGEEPLGTRLAQAQTIVDRALASQQPAQQMDAIVKSNAQIASTMATVALADPTLATTIRAIGLFTARKAPIDQQNRFIPEQYIYRGRRVYVPAPSFAFCIPSNLSIETFRAHATLNLRKIRHCQSIAGLPLQLDPYVLPNAQEASLQTFDLNGQLPIFNLPALQPLPYRYATLIERTRQLAQFAQQIEDKMLAAIANQDAQAYDELKARQDLALAQAGVRLNDLQLVEASDGVTLAQLQQGRAQIQQQHYSDLLSAGVNGNEQASLNYLTAAAALQQMQALIQVMPAITDFVAENFMGGIQQLGTAMGTQAQALTTLSQLSSASASYERRAQDWQLQQNLAAQDVLIGDQQIQIARDHVLLTAQNRAIAAMQANNAEVLLDFITTKRFTNGALYEWMAGVLQQVYRFFLQQAISMAQLAEFQLAFERQQIVPAFIQPDYWQPPATSAFAAPSSPAPADTRGLTGAERLLADITALDQYAFQTDQRKLQLTRVISLAQLDAFAFQQFRQTGVLRFATPMELFDRDFPGHYLRLIKRVSTSIIALIPPSQGIRATLATTGTSRVVIGGNAFQKVVLQRGPEQVVLSSPANATGLFTLDAQSDLLAPFEGIGVDTTWELQMPRAVNPFDYNTIADVLITLDYTALSSTDYQQQVLRKLDLSVSADRAYSFRYQFADQWYALHHPNQFATPMVVTFTTESTDFPPNLTDIPTIRHIVLYFVPKADQPIDIKAVQLLCDGTGGSADTLDGVISTRRGNAASWIPMIGKPAAQQWTLDLSNSSVAGPGTNLTIQDLFDQEKISDILFVLSYGGTLPSWPA